MLIYLVQLFWYRVQILYVQPATAKGLSVASLGQSIKGLLNAGQEQVMVKVWGSKRHKQQPNIVKKSSLPLLLLPPPHPSTTHPRGMQDNKVGRLEIYKFHIETFKGTLYGGLYILEAVSQFSLIYLVAL